VTAGVRERARAYERKLGAQQDVAEGVVVVGVACVRALGGEVELVGGEAVLDGAAPDVVHHGDTGHRLKTTNA